MKKIVAIGGGEIGRPGFPVETTKIDKETIRLAGKKCPRLLFLPTASSDSKSYAKIVDRHFGRRLGCRVETLFLLSGQLKPKEIKRKIMDADIIYVGGGNTLKMMKAWRRLKVDKLLRQAAAKGTVLSGISAGAICWFAHGLSDSLTFVRKNAPLIKVRGLGLVKGTFCPHYNKEKNRRSELKKMMRKTTNVAIAADDCAALEITDNKYRIINSRLGASVYKVYWKDGDYFEKKLILKQEFSPINKLLLKD
jgi:dipeptidase E